MPTSMADSLYFCRNVVCIRNILAQEEQPCDELKGVVPVKPAQQKVADQGPRYG